MNATSIPLQRGFSWSAFVWKTTLILIPIITAGLLLWLRHVEVRALAQRTVSSYGTVPNFQLVNQEGQPFGSAQLAGKIWIADFIYTSCPPKSAIYDLSHNGFKLAVSDGSNEAGIPVHSTRMVLVDRHGEIRGYYEATEADAVTKLLADTSHLLREQPK